MQGSSYILNSVVNHEFNKTSRLLTFSMLFALVVSTATIIYPMIYFSEVEIIRSKLKNSQPVHIVLVQSNSVKINVPTVSNTNSALISQSLASHSGSTLSKNETISNLLLVNSINRIDNNKPLQKQLAHIVLPSGRSTIASKKPKDKNNHRKIAPNLDRKVKKVLAKAKTVATRKLKAKPIKKSIKIYSSRLNKTKEKNSTTSKAIHQSVQPLYKLTVMPAFSHKEKPKYPEIEIKLDTESVVIAAATIDNTGTVKQVQIVQTGGSNFDKAVISALYKSKFYPAFIDNLAVATKLQIPYEFKLE